ncbi:MAG TPA: hypothetical protein VK206_10675 [Anaerolineales bacterium]|nr:hypothetical protein [Anaerolineales bacterium]
MRINTPNLLKKYLEMRGKVVCSREHYDSLVNFTIALLETGGTAGSDVDSIVFSKDRAMQLHAFLGSYVDNVSNRGMLTVLYKASDERHQRSYDELQQIFFEDNIIFCKEHDFRSQLIGLCEDSAAGKILFFVDDMLFTHTLDVNSVRAIDSSRYILALSRGRDFTYSIVLQKQLSLPPFYEKVNGFECFKWNDLQEISDWTFPLGVSGFMFGRNETIAMFKSAAFKAPNSLERSMQQFVPYFKGRFGLCTEQAVCTCVHANMAQSEWTNHTLGTFSIEELLALWETGKIIDRRSLYGKPVNVAQETRYTFIDR